MFCCSFGLFFCCVVVVGGGVCFWGWLVCLFGGGFVCLVFGKQNPVSVIIPEEKPVTAGGF